MIRRALWTFTKGRFFLGPLTAMFAVSAVSVKSSAGSLPAPAILTIGQIFPSVVISGMETGRQGGKSKEAKGSEEKASIHEAPPKESVLETHQICRVKNTRQIFYIVTIPGRSNQCSKVQGPKSRIQGKRAKGEGPEPRVIGPCGDAQNPNVCGSLP